MAFNKNFEGEQIFSKLTRDVGEGNYRLRGKKGKKKKKLMQNKPTFKENIWLIEGIMISYDFRVSSLITRLVHSMNSPRHMHKNKRKCECLRWLGLLQQTTIEWMSSEKSVSPSSSGWKISDKGTSVRRFWCVPQSRSADAHFVFQSRDQ